MRSKRMCKLISMLVLCATAIGTLTGCPPEPSGSGEYRLEIPAEIAENLAENPEDEKTPEIHFYFNNTADTKGYFSKKLAGENGVYVRGEFDENAVINTYSFINAIKASFDEKYKTVEYSIEKKNSVWEWANNPSVYSACAENEFYIGVDQNEKTLMKDLIDDINADSQRSSINFYLTSLAELDNNINDLAEWVKGNINVKEDYSACVLCVLCDYNGKIYPGNSTTPVEDKEITGKKPLYLIMTGPSAALESYAKTLEDSLDTAGFDEETEYSFYFFPEIKPQNIEKITDEVIVIDSFKYEGDLNDKQEESLIKEGMFNANVNLVEYEKTDYDEILEGVDDYLDMFVFKYDDESDSIVNDRMIMNLYVPLYDCDESVDSSYESYLYIEEKKGEAEESESEYVSFYYYEHPDSNSSVTGEGEDAAKNTLLMATEIDAFDFDKRGFEITTSIIDGGDVPEYAFENLPEAYENSEVEIGTAETLDSAHKWLKINLEYVFDPSEVNGKASVMLNIPVYALMRSTLPSWVDNCTCDVADYNINNADALAKTGNLDNFMNKLAGESGDSDAKAYKTQFEEKIANVAVCIYDIPVAG